MSIDSVVRVLESEAVWTEENPQPPMSVEIARYLDKVAFLATDIDAEQWPLSATLLGSWDAVTGQPIGAIQSDYFDYVRPLGNTPEGWATDDLDGQRWQGHSEKRHVVWDNETQKGYPYPSDTQPFHIKAERYWHEQPPWSGWAVRYTIVFDDPNRDPTARAIAIYDENWNYLYTHGAFSEQDTDGNWFTTTPVGRATAEPEDVYYGLLLGSVMEGGMVLLAGDTDLKKQFWESKQAGATGGTAGAPPNQHSGEIDLDADGALDSVIADTPSVTITEDVDSINIDHDKNGDADVVIPKP